MSKPKLSFPVLGANPKRSVETSDYTYMVMKNGKPSAVAKDPVTGRNLIRFMSAAAFTPAEIAKMPKFKSKTGGASRTRSATRSKSRSGSRKGGAGRARR